MMTTKNRLLRDVVAPRLSALGFVAWYNHEPSSQGRRATHRRRRALRPRDHQVAGPRQSPGHRPRDPPPNASPATSPKDSRPARNSLDQPTRPRRTTTETARRVRRLTPTGLKHLDNFRSTVTQRPSLTISVTIYGLMRSSGRGIDTRRCVFWGSAFGDRPGVQAGAAASPDQHWEVALQLS